MAAIFLLLLFIHPTCIHAPLLFLVSPTHHHALRFLFNSAATIYFLIHSLLLELQNTEKETLRARNRFAEREKGVHSHTTSHSVFMTKEKEKEAETEREVKLKR